MLVSYKYGFIYIKTIKTASTSVEMALRNYCLPDNCAVEDNRAIETEVGIVGARGSGAGK